MLLYARYGVGADEAEGHNYNIISHNSTKNSKRQLGEYIIYIPLLKSLQYHLFNISYGLLFTKTLSETRILMLITSRWKYNIVMQQVEAISINKIKLVLMVVYE
ncbi:hypothetical protein QTP88_018195 [Uroleucon formosanum]